jgi:hypothetical protein
MMCVDPCGRGIPRLEKFQSIGDVSAATGAVVEFWAVRARGLVVFGSRHSARCLSIDTRKHGRSLARDVRVDVGDGVGRARPERQCMPPPPMPSMSLVPGPPLQDASGIIDMTGSRSSARATAGDRGRAGSSYNDRDTCRRDRLFACGHGQMLTRMAPQMRQPIFERARRNRLVSRAEGNAPGASKRRRDGRIHQDSPALSTGAQRVRPRRTIVDACLSAGYGPCACRWPSSCLEGRRSRRPTWISTEISA